MLRNILTFSGCMLLASTAALKDHEEKLNVAMAMAAKLVDENDPEYKNALLLARDAASTYSGEASPKELEDKWVETTRLTIEQAGLNAALKRTTD